LHRSVVSNDMLFWNLSLPSKAAGSSFLTCVGGLTSYSVWENPEVFHYSGRARDFNLLGDTSSLSDAELQARARAFRIGMLLQWEPVFNDVGLRRIIEVDSPNGVVRSASTPADIVTRWLRITFPSSIDFERASTEMSGTSSWPDWSAKRIAMKGPTASLSAIAIGTAEAADGNVIAYLPRNGDFVVDGRKEWSLQDAVRAANVWDVNGEWVLRMRQERSGVNPTTQMNALRLSEEVSRADVGGILVLSYKRAFMDSLFDFPAKSRLAFSAFGLKDSVAFADVLLAVAAIEGTTDRSSLCPMDAYQWCNPWSLYPFALAYSRSSTFRDWIDNIKVDQEASRSLAELESVAKQAILTGVRASAHQSSYIEQRPLREAIDPIVSRDWIVRGDDVSIVVTRQDHAMLIRVVSGSQDLWQTWVRGFAD